MKIKIFTMYNMITVKDIRVFVNTLDKFLEYLGDNFEIIQKDVSMIKSVTDLLKTTNPQLMMTQFHQYVSVYSDEIHECNDAFLDNLSKDQFDSTTFDIFVKVKEIWGKSDTTDKQKATIWFFLKTLLKASSGSL
jgi:hypothetical protein